MALRQSQPARYAQPHSLAAIALGLIVAAGTVAMTCAAEAQNAAERDVLTVVDALFDAMRRKDPDALRAPFLPEARLGTAGVDGWVEQVSTSSAELDEVTYDESVWIDDDLAVAWTPYTLYVDGALHHCGVDSFVMQRRDGAWKILQLNDTRRTENCPDPHESRD